MKELVTWFNDLTKMVRLTFGGTKTGRALARVSSRGVNMGDYIEIERRFFLNDDAEQPWKQPALASQIRQHYLDSSKISVKQSKLSYNEVVVHMNITPEQTDTYETVDDWTSRIRFRNEEAILTLKGKRTHASALELEWEIDAVTAGTIPGLTECPTVFKTRYTWKAADGLLWEIDEFEGPLTGLILAEVELPNEEFPVLLPEWIGEEITGLHQWSNSSLARNGWP